MLYINTTSLAPPLTTTHMSISGRLRPLKVNKAKHIIIIITLLVPATEQVRVTNLQSTQYQANKLMNLIIGTTAVFLTWHKIKAERQKWKNIDYGSKVDNLMITIYGEYRVEIKETFKRQNHDSRTLYGLTLRPNVVKISDII